MPPSHRKPAPRAPSDAARKPATSAAAEGTAAEVGSAAEAASAVTPKASSGAGGRLARRIGRHAWSGLAVAGRHRVASTRLWRQSNPPDDAWGSLSMAYPRARNPTNTTTTGRRKSIAIRWLGAVQGSTGATAIVTSLPSRVPFQHRFATFATLTLGRSLIDTRFSATEEGSCVWSRPRCRRRRVVNGSGVIERGRR